MKDIKTFLQRYLFGTFGIAIVALLLISASFWLIHPYLKLDEKQHSLDINMIYYVFAVFISFVLAFIVWIKSKEALTRARMTYLLRIDERWSSTEIVEAREVIHELYLEAKKSNPKYENEQIKPIIAQDIMELKDNKDEIKEFIKLLNFLDFLETIGYLHDKEAITTEEVSELLGNSIIYFYDIFSLYISYRRNKDIGFYIKFEKLYLELRTKKCR